MSWRRFDATRSKSDAFTSREGRTLAASEHRNFLVLSSNHNPLDLIERDLIGAPIIEARRAGTFMVGHLLGDFQLAPVAEIFRNPRRAEGMIADLGPNTDRRGATANHAVGVRLRHRLP